MDHKVKQYIYGPTLSQIPINEQAQILLRFSNIFQSETDSRSRICSFYNVLSEMKNKKILSSKLCVLEFCETQSTKLNQI